MMKIFYYDTETTVAKYLGIEVDESKLHDAEYDVNLLIQIYKKVTF